MDSGSKVEPQPRTPPVDSELIYQGTTNHSLGKTDLSERGFIKFLKPFKRMSPISELAKVIYVGSYAIYKYLVNEQEQVNRITKEKDIRI